MVRPKVKGAGRREPRRRSRCMGAGLWLGRALSGATPRSEQAGVGVWLGRLRLPAEAGAASPGADLSDPATPWSPE